MGMTRLREEVATMRRALETMQGAGGEGGGAAPSERESATPRQIQCPDPRGPRSSRGSGLSERPCRRGQPPSQHDYADLRTTVPRVIPANGRAVFPPLDSSRHRLEAEQQNGCV